MTHYWNASQYYLYQGGSRYPSLHIQASSSPIPSHISASIILGANLTDINPTRGSLSDGLTVGHPTTDSLSSEGREKSPKFWDLNQHLLGTKHAN